MVEIHTHGNPLILEKLTAALVRGGARPAAPGEFTRRAVENGKMTLSGADPDTTLPLVHDHLQHCADCRQEFEALLDAISTTRSTRDANRQQ